ncbi:MAG: SAM-dependent methyltransferase [Chloroflexi bacterium]|nr:SAM-dependent methyltransferase [Chloroflexota bacterium]
MSNNSVEQEPSETAVFAALRRAIAYKEFNNERIGPDFLAEYFLPAHFRFFIKFRRLRANVKDKLHRFLPGLYEYVIARTAYFDAVFVDALRKEVPQIVLLGAGYDSRAYRFVGLNQATRIIELDIASTQNRKKRCLRKEKIDIPGQVTLVPINFNTESLNEALEKAGYDKGKQTLFLWEGVSYYLQPEAVAETLEFVSHSAHHESAIVFDYTVSITEENINWYGVREFSETMKERHAAEELLFAIDEGDTESFLEQRGLKMVERLDNEEIEKAFLLNEDESSIGHITGHFRFVLASPNDEYE